MSKFFLRLAFALATVHAGLATTITFTNQSGGSFGDTTAIPQECGDRVTATSDAVCSYLLGSEGATPNVLVEYGSRSSGIWSTTNSLIAWTTAYGSLTDVAYRTGGSGMRFVADAGFQVSLLDFKIGGWSNTNRNVRWQVFDGSFNSVFDSGTVVAPGQGFLTLSPQVTGTDLYLIATGGDFFNSGIDDVRFSQSQINTGGEIPEPSTWLMGLAGLAVGGFRMRRK